MKTEEKLLALFKLAKKGNCSEFLKVDLEKADIVYGTLFGTVQVVINNNPVVYIGNLERFINEGIGQYGYFLESLRISDHKNHKSANNLLKLFFFTEDGKARYFDRVVDERIDALYLYFFS